jgi:surface protein
MSVRTVSASPTTSNAGLNTKILQETQPWMRNPSWPAISAVAGDNKLVGLYAVRPGVGGGGNFFAAICSGAYTINFGDGTTTNFAAGTQANYEFNYDNVALAGTDAPVTLTDAGDLVTRTAHGYTNGMTVQFYNIVTTTGLTSGLTYFVINATANTFQVSTTPAGAAVALTNNGSAALLPYKIAVVTITPQAGQTLTSINLGVRYNIVSISFPDNPAALDIAVACSTLTTLIIGSPAGSVNPCFLEQVKVVQVGAMTSTANMFQGCSALRNVELFNTAAVTNTAFMFKDCRSLTTVPLFNTAAVTTMQQMFFGSTLLRSVPLFNTAAVTDMSQMFQDCSSLTAVPLFNTAAVTNMGSMFSGCSSLTTVPLFNTAAVTNMSSMFSSSTILKSVPLFNTAAVTNMGSMFQACSSLTTVPLFNTAAVTFMNSMFNSCRSLKSVPLFNTAAVTLMNGMFQSCVSLTTVPLFNTAAVTNMSLMFFNCGVLQAVPAFNTAAVPASSGFNSMFTSTPNIRRIQATPFRFTFSVGSCKLSAAALNEIYTNLPSVTSQTITVSGNYGTASDNPAIATAKGWAVSG